MSDLMKFLVVGNQSFEVCDAAARAGIGSPLMAAEAADMTDTDKVYVYVGDETGYENGHWYYYDGSDWQDGGIYNSAAIQLDTTLSIAGEAADAKAVGDALAEKANIDGEYESMTVGNAEQLVATVGENNKTPYNFRTSGGSIDIGDREVDKLIGGTVAWNQLSDFPDSANWIKQNVTSSYSNGELTVVSNASDTVAKFTSPRAFEPSIYYIRGYGKTDGTTEINVGAWQNNGANFTDTVGTAWSSSTSYVELYQFVKMTSSSSLVGARLRNTTPSGNYGVFKDIEIFNLTQMFSSTIADYIYSLEQGTAGAGVAFFRKLFPATYYAYNAGELMSVKTSSHDMVGFNAYDNSTGKAKLVGGMEYQITGTYTAISYSTGETLTPDANGKFTPTADGELTVTGGNGSDTCVHLVWDGERDGEYEPYKKYSYALDSDLELRGLFKLDASNNLYCDGDTYEDDGTVTRRYGKVNLGDLTWIKDDSTVPGKIFFRAQLTNAKNGFMGISSIYPFKGSYSNIVDKSCGYILNTRIAIEDSAYDSVDATAFKTAMNGIYLEYELATSTTETADPFTNPQIVDDWGTEEYVDSRTVAIPVGHDTMYQANLRAKLEMMPNLPEVNGDYVLRQSASGAEYVAHTSPIPALPSEDGTYVLKCTVADGTATLTWEAQT